MRQSRRQIEGLMHWRML
ncbi:unnamed protein product [Linum tenue]|uniref:Uncharacterized protein n=1 Tax=Linum tenue TaxID=586396 RepID=A0AAV0QJ56_9ROSI|nr:unnamed protein product [Linum tenue]CAI0544891.1 unnamed protein product [Linum tenue]